MLGGIGLSNWLRVVGAGISAVNQLTMESKDYIQRADVVFYLVTNSVISRWIIDNSKSSEDLYPLYDKERERYETYELMIAKINDAFRSGKNVCAVFYGHPGVFCFPGHEVVRRLRGDGADARMLAGVSSLDTMFADLNFDPGVTGLQCFEATDFLVHQRVFDPRVNLVILQIGVIGEIHFPTKDSYKSGVSYLSEVLAGKYNPSHVCVVYEAAEFKFSDPKIEKTTIDLLAGANITPISTLYIPPQNESVASKEVLENLNMDANRKYGRIAGLKAF